jgi:hypothetical protein
VLGISAKKENLTPLEDDIRGWDTSKQAVDVADNDIWDVPKSKKWKIGKKKEEETHFTIERRWNSYERRTKEADPRPDDFWGTSDPEKETAKTPEGDTFIFGETTDVTSEKD